MPSSSPSREAQRKQIGAIAQRVARSHGLELFDVQLRREPVGWVVRVIIDRPADDGDDLAVGIDDCQRVSRDLGAVLDVEDPLDHAYTLEVSSPGLDRPLRGAEDYRRFAGRLAKIVVAEAIDGQRALTGRIAGVEGDVVVLSGRARTHRIPLELITRGRLEVEFQKKSV